jgi:hypothetical protein
VAAHSPGKRQMLCGIIIYLRRAMSLGGKIRGLVIKGEKKQEELRELLANPEYVQFINEGGRVRHLSSV